jgi:oligopeptide/dipeptide ABC transporter ATP-binding protein
MNLRKGMQIIFQDPYSSLNPRKTIRSILGEAFFIHKYSKEETVKSIEKVCGMVDLSRDLLDCFPHELDGGMRQVVGIARALSLSAEFIVCDEPVSSLDVSVQARIINLLMDLQEQLGISYLFISHDLSVVRHISKRIAIMYLGQIVELAETDDIFEKACHPYSIALLSAIPQIDQTLHESRIVLKGDVPSPMNPKPGCRFAPRCWMAHEDCLTENPQTVEFEPGHFVACKYVGESRERALTASV